MNKKTSIIAKIRELFEKEDFATDYTAATGEIIRCMGDGLRVGEKVVNIAAEKEAPLPDGDYLLNNGKTISVAAGEIKAINEYRAEENMGSAKPELMADYTTKEQKDTGSMVEKPGGEKDKMEDYKNEIKSKLADGTEVKILSKGDALSVGDEVMVKTGEGTFVKAPAGRHELEGGLVIYTDGNGFINELETKETEDIADGEEMKKMFEAVSQLTSLITDLKSEMAEIKKENTDLNEKFSKFAAEPSAESVTKKSSHFSKTTEKQNKLKFFGQK
jgi:prefoldin subunit 5